MFFSNADDVASDEEENYAGDDVHGEDENRQTVKTANFYGISL